MFSILKSGSTASLILAVAAGAALAIPSAVVTASTIAPGTGIIKFSQEPLNNVAINGAIYNGHDESSYATLGTTGIYQGHAAADDFSDYYNSPVIGVNWWGSYPLLLSSGVPSALVPTFLISFESDVPSGPNNPFSHPGPVLLAQSVTRSISGALAPGLFTETPVGPTNDLYLYQALLTNPFPESAGTVYWLKIAALFPQASSGWGWHNRNYTLQDTLANPGDVNENTRTATPVVWHFGDNGVTGFLNYTPSTNLVDEGDFTQLVYNPSNTTTDGPAPVTGLSEDLAFQLVTTPEPTAWLLLATGVAAFALIPGQKRSARRSSD